MSSHDSRVQNMGHNATRVDLVPRSPAVATAKKDVTPEQLGRIFDSLAGIGFLSVWFLFYFCYSHRSVCAYVGALVVSVLTVVATFGIYCVFKPHFEPPFKQPSEPDPGDYEDVPLPPPDLINSKRPGDQNLDLDHDFDLPPSVGQQSADVSETVDTDRFKSVIRPTNGSRYYDKAQGRMVPIQNHKYYNIAQKKIVYASSGGLESSGEHNIWAAPETHVYLQEVFFQSPHTVHPVSCIQANTVISQQHLESQKTTLTAPEAEASLNALLDRMETDAKRDGPIAAEYRYRRQLKVLLEVASHTATIHMSLQKCFLTRVKKYAMKHTINHVGSLFARGITLAHSDDMVRAKAFWRLLERYEEKKRKDAANKQWSEQLEAQYANEREEKSRVKKEQLLQEIRQYAVRVGVKMAKKKFSNALDTYPHFSADIIIVLNEVHAQEIEKIREREAHKQRRLDKIRDIARTCSVESVQEQFREEIRTLIPAEQISKFWKAIHEEGLQRDAVWLKRYPREKTAFFKKIGVEAAKEALFKNTIDKRVYCRSEKTGSRIAVIYAEDTYARYKGILSVLVGQDNVRQKFLQIYDDELKRHGQFWKRLAFVKKQIEDCGSVFYVRYWSGVWIDQICTHLGFIPVEFWDHVHGEEGPRRREKEAEEKAAQAAKEQAAQAAKEQAAREQAAREQAGKEQAVKEQAAQAAAKKAAAEKAAEEKAAAEKAAAEKAAAEKAAQEKAAEEQAVQAAVRAAQQEEAETANRVQQRRVQGALAIGEASRQSRSGLFQGLALVQGKFVELRDLVENLRREQERQADEEAAQDALLDLAVNTPLPDCHRLIERTVPSVVYTPKPWDANAGGFTQYWQLQAANYPVFQPLSNIQDNGSRFNMRFARDERWPQFQEHTIYSFYGYMLRYRMVTRDLSSLQRKKLAEDGYRWPTQGNIEPLWAKWKPAGEFRLPANKRFQTIFRGMFWKAT
ncbi:hypothetical protein SLS60_008206 [Paraconiothyrium brasiliense]|uniref:Uncharacterized protein n=1 Tax=Paraconiothyrium brasiliense TaxID=300254 RepID=A0ABR3QZY2_9PLEO